MNEFSKSEAYAAAGVDITAGYRAVELMKRHIAKTVTPGGTDFSTVICPSTTLQETEMRPFGVSSQPEADVRPATA